MSGLGMGHSLSGKGQADLQSWLKTPKPMQANDKNRRQMQDSSRYQFRPRRDILRATALRGCDVK